MGMGMGALVGEWTALMSGVRIEGWGVGDEESVRCINAGPELEWG